MSTPPPSQPYPLLPDPNALTKSQQRSRDKANDLLDKNHVAGISDQTETSLALAASMKSVKSDYTALTGAVGTLIPVLVAWAVAGGGISVAFAGALAGFISVTAAVLVYNDYGATEAYAAILEHRAKNPLPAAPSQTQLPPSQTQP